MRTVQQQARYAGFLYLLVALIAPLGLVVVPGQLFVAGDATATAANIAGSEWLVRLGIGSELLHQVVQVFLVLALYRLFKPVDETLAALVVILGVLLSTPIVFVNVLNEVAALILVSGAGYLAVFDKAQLDALANLFTVLHGQGIQVVSVFWGLWLFPFGLLVIRSGFIPRVLGYLLFVAGAAYVVGSFVALVVPQYDAIVQPITTVLAIAEIPIVLWLLIWGARTPTAATQPG